MADAPYDNPLKMKKSHYTPPETSICLLNISAVLQETIDLGTGVEPISGGVINSNTSNFWDEDEETFSPKDHLWDKL